MYQPAAKCLAAATKAAASGRVTEAEVLAAFDAMDQYRRKLDSSGQLTGKAEKMRLYTEGLAQRTKIAAAMARRHAALNIMVRKRIDQQINEMLKGGMRYDKVLAAVLAGGKEGVRYSRKSLAATVEGLEGKYLGGLFAELEKEASHLKYMLRDKNFDKDVMREMYQPGSTKNKDATTVANILLKYAELARTEANRRGAAIGKLNRWAGPQVHDDIKMIHAGKDEWVGYISTLLDVERTFPEGISGEEMAVALGDMYDTIITGIDNKVSAAEKGVRVNPANLAKSLGKSRVLHFKGIDEAIAYREQFGNGSAVSGMIAHLQRSARMVGAMETLGPNPEVMFASLAEAMKRRIKADDRLTPGMKSKIAGRLDLQHGTLRHALDIALGFSARPVNVTMSRIGNDIRALQSMAKLGMAVISSVSDTITAASASQFRGDGFLRGFTQQVSGMMRGRPRAEQAEISFLAGEGFDAFIGHIHSYARATDGALGVMAKMQEGFFRWNGLSWWTDVNRSVASRVLAASMGMKLQKGWDKIDPRMRHILDMHGFDEVQWSVLQKAKLRLANGKTYLTPDRIRDMDDADFEPMIADQMDELRRLSRVDEAKSEAVLEKRTADLEERIARALEKARWDLEMQVHRLFADENSMAVIQTDDRSRRTATMGTSSGTVVGEIVRFIMQFKGFPIAFSQRIGGRMLYGQRKDAQLLERYGNIASLMVGLTAAGYAAMVMKDTIKGYWPPRDPSKWETIMAAMQQGGAWGIYGDYLFSAKSRFGSDVLETAVGPTIGNVSQLIQTGLNARSYALGQLTGDDMAKFSGSQAFNTLWGNVPYANLFYTKAALDYMFVNSMREWASPGYLRRSQRNRNREYGQERLNPLGLGPSLQSDMAR